MGDLFFNGMYPFIDAGSGGSITGMIAACDRVLALADDRTRIIPGHGPLGDRAQLREFRDMLVAVRDRIGPMVKSGKTLEEVRDSKPTRELDAKWGGGFLKPDAFVRVAYGVLSKEK
jgi:glyoxylase-like metal-dependent hydrolase (beta-lactamase superfamily II)